MPQQAAVQAAFPVEGGDKDLEGPALSALLQKGTEAGREGREGAASPWWLKTEECLARHVPRSHFLSRMCIVFL